MLGALIGGGLGLLGSIIGGDKAKQAAKSTVPVPYGVTGPAGGMAIDPKTKQMTLTQADNPFAQVFQALGLGSLGNAAVAPNQPMYGANPELMEAYKGLFGQGLTDRVQGQYDLLSELAAPGENRARLALNDQQFGMGQLGTTGGAERFGALTEAQQQADLQRQVAALGLGRQEALDRFTGAQGTIEQGMAGQLQNFNVGSGAFGGMQQLMENLFRQSGLGIAAGGGQAPGAAMYSAQAGMAPYQAGANFLTQLPWGDMLKGGGAKSPLADVDLSQWGISGDFGLN